MKSGTRLVHNNTNEVQTLPPVVLPSWQASLSCDHLEGNQHFCTEVNRKYTLFVNNKTVFEYQVSVCPVRRLVSGHLLGRSPVFLVAPCLPNCIVISQTVRFLTFNKGAAYWPGNVGLVSAPTSHMVVQSSCIYICVLMTGAGLGQSGLTVVASALFKQPSEEHASPPDQSGGR